jgi:hypothetical protein
MEMKKILLVSNGFYPEISPRSYRATELAKEFCRQGHSVTVITRFRNHDYTDFLGEYPIILKMWKKAIFPIVPESDNKYLSLISRALIRFLSLLFEYPDIEQMFQVKKYLKKENGYDLMISFAVPYPVQWGVAWARTKNHPIAHTWVADCGDPYMGDTLDSFRKLFYFKYVEKWFCRKTDYISIPVKTAIPGYYPEFQGKIRIIPQGFDFDLNASSEDQKINEMPEFAYAGRFLKGIRDPSMLMQFLKKIDVPFKFYIFTDQPEIINEYKEALNNKLIISPYIARKELMKRLSNMDFLINFDNNTLLNVPSKLIDYAIIDRPVLNIDRSFTLEDLLAFIQKDYRKKLVLPDPKQYHIQNVTKLFLDLI